jgi:hypothetical protein
MPLFHQRVELICLDLVSLEALSASEILEETASLNPGVDQLALALFE